MVKKITIKGAFIFMLFFLVACDNKNMYNASIYDDSGKWMNEKFLEDNLTRGVYYNGRYLDDDSYPNNINHLITNEEEFEEVFTEFPLEIDFTKSMICIYVFTSNDKRTYEISNISLDNQILKIEVKSIKPRPGKIGDGVPSWQRCLVVKINKLDISSVEFVNHHT